MRKQGSGGGALVEDEDKLMRVVQLTAGYSGSDLSAVCHEAAMGPIRELGPAALLKVKAEEVRAVGQGARWGRVRGRKLAFFHLVPMLPVLPPPPGVLSPIMCACVPCPSNRKKVRALLLEVQRSLLSLSPGSLSFPLGRCARCWRKTSPTQCSRSAPA